MLGIYEMIKCTGNINRFKLFLSILVIVVLQKELQIPPSLGPSMLIPMSTSTTTGAVSTAKRSTVLRVCLVWDIHVGLRSGMISSTPDDQSAYCDAMLTVSDPLPNISSETAATLLSKEAYFMGLKE